MRYLAALLCWLALVSVAHAQSVQQSGTVTPTHFACWTTGGVIQDCGTAAQPFGSTIGMTPGPLCLNSGPVTGPYQAFCLTVGSTGGVLSIQNYGGAAAGGISLLINGATASLANVIIPTVNGDGACFNNTSGTLVDCGFVPISGTLPHTHIFVGNSSNQVADYGSLATFSDHGTLTLAPTAATTNQGVNITQTSPTTGSAVGPLSYNYISVTNQIANTGSGLTNGFPNQDTGAFRVDMFLGGGSTTQDNSFAGIFTASDVNSGGTVQGIRGVIGFAYTNQSLNGMHGTDGVTLVDVGGSVTQYGGMEASAGICDGTGTDAWCSSTGTSGTAGRRYGISLITIGRTIATTTDTAIIVANNGTAGSAWNKLISLSSYGGNAPLQTSADFFYSESSYTVANIFNLPNITVTGDILNFPNVTLTGAGVMNVAAGGSYEVNADTFLIRRGAAIWQFGQADVAGSPVAQALAMQNATGISNTAGANFILAGSRGTGTGVGGNISFEVAPAGSSGSTTNPLSALLTLTGSGTIGIGTSTAPSNTLVAISGNTSAANYSGAVSGTTTYLQLIGADSVIPNLVVDGFADGPNLSARRADGTAGSPSTVGSGENVFAFGAYTYTAAASYSLTGAIVFITTATQTSGSSLGSKISFRTSANGGSINANAMTLFGDGGLAIDSATDPGTGNLLVNGSVTATLSNTATTSAVCYNTSTGLFSYDSTIGTCNTSTIRVKHDVRPMRVAALDAVMRMRPVSYYYNADQHTPDEQIGFIAEDLDAIDPRLVALDKSGKPFAIRYLGPMFSYVVGAIHQLKADNDNLRRELYALKRKIR